MRCTWRKKCSLRFGAWGVTRQCTKRICFTGVLGDGDSVANVALVLVGVVGADAVFSTVVVFVDSSEQVLAFIAVLQLDSIGGKTSLQGWWRSLTCRFLRGNVYWYCSCCMDDFVAWEERAGISVVSCCCKFVFACNGCQKREGWQGTTIWALSCAQDNYILGAIAVHLRKLDVWFIVVCSALCIMQVGWILQIWRQVKNSKTRTTWFSS